MSVVWKYNMRVCVEVEYIAQRKAKCCVWLETTPSGTEISEVVTCNLILVM